MTQLHEKTFGFSVSGIPKFVPEMSSLRSYQSSGFCDTQVVMHKMFCVELHVMVKLITILI